MNQINGMTISQGTKWISRNPKTGKNEEIHEEDELIIGSYALRLDWSNECKRYVTTAGSLHKLTSNGWEMEID